MSHIYDIIKRKSYVPWASVPIESARVTVQIVDSGASWPFSSVSTSEFCAEIVFLVYLRALDSLLPRDHWYQVLHNAFCVISPYAYDNENLSAYHPKSISFWTYQKNSILSAMKNEFSFYSNIYSNKSHFPRWFSCWKHAFGTWMFKKPMFNVKIPSHKNFRNIRIFDLENHTQNNTFLVLLFRSPDRSQTRVRFRPNIRCTENKI